MHIYSNYLNSVTRFINPFLSLTTMDVKYNSQDESSVWSFCFSLRGCTKIGPVLLRITLYYTNNTVNWVADFEQANCKYVQWDSISQTTSGGGQDHPRLMCRHLWIAMKDCLCMKVIWHQKNQCLNTSDKIFFFCFFKLEPIHWQLC